MQTFLPYSSFEQSAACLDRQRLGKQRIEVLQLLKALYGESRGWAHHPACKMWMGHEQTLVEYGLAICREWVSRGYKDTCADKIRRYQMSQVDRIAQGPPSWLGDQAFHAAHRSNLLRKAIDHYQAFGWAEPSDLPYIWPSP